MSTFKPINQNENLIIKIMSEPEKWQTKNDVDHLAIPYKEAKQFVDIWNNESTATRKELLTGELKNKYDLFVKYIAFIDDLRKRV